MKLTRTTVRQTQHALFKGDAYKIYDAAGAEIGEAEAHIKMRIADSYGSIRISGSEFMIELGVQRKLPHAFTVASVKGKGTGAGRIYADEKESHFGGYFTHVFEYGNDRFNIYKAGCGSDGDYYPVFRREGNDSEGIQYGMIRRQSETLNLMDVYECYYGEGCEVTGMLEAYALYIDMSEHNDKGNYQKGRYVKKEANVELDERLKAKLDTEWVYSIRQMNM